jgi:hypothetical protein
MATKKKSAKATKTKKAMPVNETEENSPETVNKPKKTAVGISFPNRW